jgi:predicted HAD superfamily Cof-like phosphohydrolase
MQQPDSLKQVAEFHRTFRHPILEQPTIPDATRCNLRVSLIAEELEELREAIANQDIVEIADALCDIQYVLSGAILEFGMGHKFKTLFDEVQRSNMSKACKTEEEAIATVNHFREKKGEECYYQKVEDLYLVYRTNDNKTMKSINYSPADLKGLL